MKYFVFFHDFGPGYLYRDGSRGSGSISVSVSVSLVFTMNKILISQDLFICTAQSYKKVKKLKPYHQFPHLDLSDQTTCTTLRLRNYIKVSKSWTSLNLSNVKLTGKLNAGGTLKLSKITQMNFSGANLTDSNFVELLKLTNALVHLDISFTRLSLDCLAPQRKFLYQIEKLILKGCNLNDNTFLNILNICKRVKYLDLSDTSITATGVDIKKSTLKLTQLEHLTLVNCNELTEQGLFNLLKISKGSLHTVTVTSSDNLTAKLLAGLKSVFPHIQTVNIYHKDNTNIRGKPQTSNDALPEEHGESSYGADPFSTVFEIALAPEIASEQDIAANSIWNESSHVIGKDHDQEDIVPDADPLRPISSHVIGTDQYQLGQEVCPFRIYSLREVSTI